MMKLLGGQYLNVGLVSSDNQLILVNRAPKKKKEDNVRYTFSNQSAQVIHRY